MSSISKKINDHYFSAKPRSKNQKFEVRFAIRNEIFNFVTSKGVFSPKKVDLGTKVLLKYAEYPNEGVIADLGCGYGIIGIVISKLNPNLTIHFYDINKRSIQLTRKNAKLNELKRFEVYEGDYISSLNDNNQFYDAIYINPPIKLGQNKYISHIISAIEFLKTNSSIFIIIKRSLGAQGVIYKIKNIYELKEISYTIDIKVKKSSGYWLIEIKKIE